MTVPALVYLAIAGGTAPRGWAIVVATDIPLALGVLAIAGSRVSPELRVYLLAIAIVDDIGSLLIIAAVYSTGVGWWWVVVAFGALSATLIARRLGVRQMWVYVGIGCVLWLALHEAGVSPTLAGVSMGMLAPTTPRMAAEFVDIEELADLSSVEAARTTSDLARGTVSVVEWLEHVLHPWVSYAIIPLFALANTGVTLSVDLLHSAVRSPITWGIIAARVIGKPLGIIGATKTTLGARLADRPGHADDRQMLGVAASAGMGFTVALFVTELALHDETQRADATLAIVVAAVVAAGTSLAILNLRRGEPS
jgi:Na+/H+ antiporter NhaA